jgi:hypothetical protein
VVVDEVRRQRTEGGWGRTASVAGTVAAVALLAQSLLFFLDTSVLPENPPFQETDAGRAADLARFFVARAERQHDVLWNIVLRDVLGPVGAVALVVLAYAFVRARGGGRPAMHVFGLVLSVGALLKAVSDLVYLSLLAQWRYTGFTPEPPADMIAVGRATDTVIGIADLLEQAADVTVVVGLVGLAALLPRRLRMLAWVVAAALVLLTVSALAGWSQLYDVLSLVEGVLLVPVLLVGTARWVARAEARTAGR